MHIFQLSNWLNSSFWEQYRNHKHNTGKKKNNKENILEKKKKYKVSISKEKTE